MKWFSIELFKAHKRSYATVSSRRFQEKNSKEHEQSTFTKNLVADTSKQFNNAGVGVVDFHSIF